MKKIILSLLILATAFGSFAQSADQQNGQKMTKKQQEVAKQENKIKANEEIHRLNEITNLMLTDKRFVLESDYVGDQTGQRVPVTSNLNFISVDTTHATLQLGSFNGVGINGVGGITVDGKVLNYKLHKKELKNGNSNYYVQMTVLTSTGSYDIAMDVSDTGRADATVSGSVSGQLVYYGNLVPLSLSRVYKGTPYM